MTKENFDQLETEIRKAIAGSTLDFSDCDCNLCVKGDSYLTNEGLDHLAALARKIAEKFFENTHTQGQLPLHAHQCVAGAIGESLALRDRSKVVIVRGKGAEAAPVWLANVPCEQIKPPDETPASFTGLLQHKARGVFDVSKGLEKMRQAEAEAGPDDQT